MAATTRTSTGIGRAAADRRHLALLQHAQQLRLHAARHLADLVEEQRAAVRGRQAARARPVGAGEGAAHVPEQLGLGERLGDGRQLTATNGPVAARAGAVNEPGDDLLAGAGLAADEHAGVGVGDLVDALEHQPHRAGGRR